MPNTVASVKSDTAPPRRATYRHGDLRNALVAAGVDLAREGGPPSVVLREATRRAGVAPNAAYRHFADRDALLGEVSIACLGLAADAMRDEIAGALARHPHSPASAARAELDAVGRAYVHFALREPGLFRTAFTVHADLSARTPDGAPPGPYGLLASALDHAVAAGLLPAERRPGAEALAWSAVHGLAGLLLDGPLRTVGEPEREHLVEGALRMVQDGLYTR